jgi:hypothetical protein
MSVRKKPCFNDVECLDVSSSFRLSVGCTVPGRLATDESAGIFEPVDGNRIVAEMQGFSALADV